MIRCVDFTSIAASNTASDDVTNLVTHRIFYTDLLYDLMIICDISLLLDHPVDVEYIPSYRVLLLMLLVCYYLCLILKL